MTRAAAGFTLVEMLVALVIFAVVTAGGTALASFALRSKEAMASGADVCRDIQLARAVMKADFGQAIVRPVRNAYGGVERFSFEGGAQSADAPLVTLVRDGWDNALGTEPRGALQYVEYVLDRGSLIRRSRVRLDPTPQTPEHDMVLLSGVQTVEVSYLADGAWSDRWQAGGAAGEALPEAVAFELDVAGLGELRQVFMVAPR